MADTFDILGRKIDSANMSLGELKSLVGSLMKSKVGPARKVGEDKPEASPINKAILELKKLFEDYTKDFKKESDEQKKLMEEVVDTLKDVTVQKQNKTTERKNSPKSEKPSSMERKMARGIEGLYQEGVVKKNSIATYDPRVAAAVHGVQSAIESLSKALGVSPVGGKTSSGKSGGGGGGKGGKGGGGFFDDDFEAKSWGKSNVDLGAQLARQFFHDVSKQIDSLENALSGFNAGKVLFDGIISKEREFIQDIRKIAYETGNATSETEKLNRKYEEIGKTVARTGMNRAEFQDEYKKALRGGIKDLKVANSITASQLNAENQLGLKAGELGEEFRKWTQSGKMSINQISAMSRGMLEVARNTGVTGDALKSAIGSSESFMKNLKNAGHFTSSAAKNIIEMSANAQKLDIASEMEPLMQAMTSSVNLLMESSDQTKSFLFSAAGSVGRIGDLQLGTALRSKEGIKDMAKGIENVMKSFGVESMDAINTLSDGAKMQLNLALKSSFNLELGQVQKVFKNLEESGKTYLDKLKDIDKKRDENLTQEEKIALAEEERRLRASHSLDILTKLDEATMSSGKNMDNAFSTFTDKLQKDLGSEFKELDFDKKTGKQIAQDEMISAIDSINQGLKKYGKDQIKLSKSEIEKVMSGQDPAAMREMLAKVNEGNERLSTAQKSNLNPMDELNQSMKELNESIKMFTNSGISGLFNSVLGKIAALIIAIGGLTASIGFFGLDILATLTGFKNTFLKASEYFSGAMGKAGLKGAAGVASEAGPTVLKTAVSKLSADDLKKFEEMKHLSAFKPQFASQEAFAKSLGHVDDLAENIVESGPFIKKFNRGFAGLKDIVQATQTKISSLGDTLLNTSDSMSKNGVKAINSYTDSANNLAKSFKNGNFIGEIGKTVNQFGNKIKDFANIGREAATDISSFAARMGTSIKNSTAFAKAGQIGSDVVDVARRTGGAVNRAGNAVKTSIMTGNAIKDLGKGASALTTASTKAAGSVLKLAGTMNPLGLAITATFAAIDIGLGAAEAGARASEIFGKNMEDVTLNEEYAAKSAGALIGLLNGISFGILGLIFPLNEWTDSLARFTAKVPILTAIMAPLVVIMEVIWGLIKGIGLAVYDIFDGLWQGIKNILMPVFEGLTDIFSSLGEMFFDASEGSNGFAQTLRDLGGIAGIVANSVRFIGTAIGWIFKTIGTVIGFILKSVLKVVQGMMIVFIPVASAFKMIGSALSEIGQVFYDVGKIIYNIFSFISSLFPKTTSQTTFLTDALWVFNNYLLYLGKSVGLVGSIILRFFLYPITLIANLIGGAAKSLRGMIKLFEGLFNLFFDYDKGKKIIFEALNLIFEGFAQQLYGIFGIFTTIFEDIISFFTGTVFDPKTWLESFKNIGYWLYEGIVSGMSNLGTYVYEGMVSVFQKIMEYVMSWIPGSGAATAATGAFTATEEANQKRVEESGASVFSGMGRMLGGIYDLSMSKMWGGIKETASASLSTINPMTYFEEGTQKVEKTGLAVLHKNEMVVPADQVQNVVAKGNGPFGKADNNCGCITELGGILGKSLQGGFSLISSASEMFNKGFEFVKQDKIMGPLISSASEMVNKGFEFVKQDGIMGPLLSTMMDSTGIFGSVSTATKNNIQPVNNTSDIHSEIAAEKVKTSPARSEVTSSELGTIASEAETHTELLETLIDLFGQVVKALKPEPTTLGSSGGNMPDTSLQKIRHKSPNFYRNNIGLVSQTTAKSVVNLGPQNI